MLPIGELVQLAIKGVGGTMIAINQTSMDSTMVEHIRPMLMV